METIVNPLPPKSFLDGDHPRNRVPIPRRNTGRLDVSGVRDMGFGRHQPKPFAARDHQARLTIAERGRPPECTTLLVIRRAALFDVFPEIPALRKGIDRRRRAGSPGTPKLLRVESPSGVPGQFVDAHIKMPAEEVGPKGMP